MLCTDTFFRPSRLLSLVAIDDCGIIYWGWIKAPISLFTSLPIESIIVGGNGQFWKSPWLQSDVDKA